MTEQNSTLPIVIIGAGPVDEIIATTGFRPDLSLGFEARRTCGIRG
jgi:hypothetical protein